jgi:acetyl-CoA acetyltransferase
MIYQDWQIQSGIALNPAYWAMRARRHMHDHGTTERQIALVAQKNHKNSVDSPICMYRKPFSLSEILASKYVCEPIRLLEICSPCDGAAAVVVTLRDTTTPAASRDVQIAASTHTTALYSADLRSPALSMSARVNNPGPTSTAADQSYQAAGLGPEDIDCLEVQDTDAFCELEAYEDLRLCAVGDGGAMIESGRTELGGAQPVNMSGGLISKGEPVGASHLGQIAEIVSQLRGEAGSRQVAGARTGLAHVLGAHGNSAVTILIR